MSKKNEVKCSYCGSTNVYHRDGDIKREFPGGFIYADYYTCESCGQYFHTEKVVYVTTNED